MINYDTFRTKLESELIRFGFIREDYVFTTSFILGDFVLYTIEHRYEKKDIWYRNTLRGYMNRVMFDENLETTQKEWDKVTESIPKVLEDYKNYRVKTKIDEMRKDFV
ncbi:MAG: hypothetical protein J6T10_01460 [Methanobrevibacter sp.]|nr:hypothetical protein [Methanobrevibacter sp.]